MYVLMATCERIHDSQNREKKILVLSHSLASTLTLNQIAANLSHRYRSQFQRTNFDQVHKTYINYVNIETSEAPYHLT